MHDRWADHARLGLARWLPPLARHARRSIRSIRSLAAAWRGVQDTQLVFFDLRLSGYKRETCRMGLRDLMGKFVQPSRVCCLSSSPSLTSLLPIFFHLARIGEDLPAYTLHHKHHAVVLLIPSTTPPYLAGPRRRSRRCTVGVQRSEALPVVALGSDRIVRRRRIVWLYYPCSNEHFHCAIYKGM
jgi:hypothetical protein